MAAQNVKWLYDAVNPNFIQLHSIKKVIYSGKSKFQSIDIIQTDQFGLCLVIDGKIQSAESDEFVYHEALVHPVMLTHPQPKKVFIAGGGEGATLREVLTYNTVDMAVMVDIDAEVIEVCRQFLPSFHKNSFSDPRVKIFFSDAQDYLVNTDERFDVIILDLTDPVEEGPSYSLFTQQFYQLVKEKLTESGIICLQAGPASWVEIKNFHRLLDTLRSVFTLVCPYQTHVPSFCDLWGFISASESLSPSQLSATEVNQRITQRVPKSLRAYDGTTHQLMFTFPRHTRHALGL